MLWRGRDVGYPQGPWCFFLKRADSHGATAMGAPPGSRAVPGEVGGRSRAEAERVGRLRSLLFTHVKSVRPGAGGGGSVGDDELVYPPVFIAPVRQVAPDDDGNLSGPVAGEKSQV